MKRTKALGLSVAAFAAVVVALTIGASTASASSYPTTTRNLYAGQTTLVGTVTVTQTAPGTIAVSYQMNAGYCLTQTHVYAGTLANVPETKTGNPIPGQFPQGETFSSCVTTAGPYTFTGLPLNVVVAAHAVVWDEGSLQTTTVVSGTNTDVTNVNGSAVTQKAVAANEPFNYPNCSSYTPDDTNPSLWDTGIGTTASSLFSGAGADWIWAAPNPIQPILGDIVDFQQGFTVPAGFQLGGTLTITADNAYSAMLNSTTLGHSISMGPGFPGTLREDVGSGPQVGDWGVASQGWQHVDTYTLSGLSAGSNTLEVTAADEYMNAGDDYLGWGGTTYNSTVNLDPTPGTGLPADGSVCFNPGYNPAGLIYSLSVGTYTHSDTAWGASAVGETPFSGSNWATYIPFTLS